MHGKSASPAHHHVRRVISCARICLQAREANARLRKELHLEQQRRQIAVGALIGSS